MWLSIYLTLVAAVKPADLHTADLHIYEHMPISENSTSVALVHMIDPIRHACRASYLKEAAGALGNLKCK
jgi:hypothetical protein